MPLIIVVLSFIIAIVITVALSRLLPIKIPLPLLQIGAGALLCHYGLSVAFDPHLFMLLFIPPLLFLDGWRMPKEALFNEFKPIMSLAVGLVVVTVIGIGFFIHWLLPGVAIATAFALAAILSPTDPVAVSAMTVNSPLPSRMGHILEGESLLNDASGLVCFNFAVIAALTGEFSLSDAVKEFFKVATGGILCGLAVVWLIGKANRFLVKRTKEEPPIQILISLLIPVITYMVAEELHVSGILAAAVAGIAIHHEELAGRFSAATKMQSNAVWDTVQVTLNGIIFILLGAQLPRMFTYIPDVAREATASNVWVLLGYITAIGVALMVVRFLWIWLSMSLQVFKDKRKDIQTIKPNLRSVAVMTVSGIKGSVTLAGILTLPLFMPDGSHFPDRDFIIFLAMGVILFSLIVATIFLPILSKNLHDD